MDLNEAFMELNQTISLNSASPLQTTESQNTNISLYNAEPLANIEPILETGDEVFGTIQEPGPASRRRKGGFRKTRRGKGIRKSRQPKKLKVTRAKKSPCVNSYQRKPIFLLK